MTATGEWAASHECEVLVIGSGAGGATTAAILAEAGHDVLIIEEGPWVDQGEVVPFSLEQMDRQYRSGGVTVALGVPSIAYTEGRCAGGGTEVNSGLYRRPPEQAIARWQSEYAIDDFDADGLLVDLRRGRRATHRADRAGRTHQSQRDPARRRSCTWLATRREPTLDVVSRRRASRRRGNAKA